MIYVIGHRDLIPKFVEIIDVTSRSKSPFSPFLNGTDHPIKSMTMENAWQYSKVYPEHDGGGSPKPEWFNWHNLGVTKSWADRYPMGKGKFPLYTWFNNQPLDYIEARKNLYDPLYRSMLERVPDAVNALVEKAKEKDIALLDFDGYNDPGKTYRDIINDPKRKMGHAFVLREVLLERLNE